MTGTKLIKLMPKHTNSPYLVSKIPPMAGPTILAALKMEEFNAMALGKSLLLSTSDIINDWRLSTSNALMTPCIKPKMDRIKTVCSCNPTTKVNTPACIINPIWVRNTTLYFLCLSTNGPTNGERISEGSKAINCTKPSQKRSEEH